MKKIILSTLAAAIAMPLATPVQSFAQTMPAGDMPAQARPGQCFQRMLVPATWRAEPMDVITQEAYEQISVSDPVFQARQESVVTADEYKRYVVTEPTFRTEAQTIVTRPAHERLVVTPAVMGARSETVVIREPRLVWRSGTNLSSVRRMDPNTGEVFCLVEEAAVTQTVTRRVQTTPAQVSRQPVPAQTHTIHRKVLVTPASVREEFVPATTQAVTIHTLTAPAAERRTMVPEQRSTINRQVLATGERYEWVAVVCENTSQGRVSLTAAQRALAARGLYRGPIDGIAGSRTVEAIRQFQRANGLPGNGSLTLETARKLGL
jgi:Putative peptidoglycan binding domain